MVAEILSIGTELLMGQIANTDAQYLSQQLQALGIDLYHQSVVGDNPQRAREALALALSRSDIVITTGGLGPTQDDITKEIVAAHFGLEMQKDEESARTIANFFRSRALPMTENNLRQANFPAGARILPNARGTAPGCIVEAEGRCVIILPGPPSELRGMWEAEVLPWLSERSDTHIVSHWMHVFGVGESALETELRDLIDAQGRTTLAMYFTKQDIILRLTAKVPKHEDAEPLFQPLRQEIRRRLGARVYSEREHGNMAETVVSILAKRGRTLATAESCTGGLVSSLIVGVPGASDVLLEGHVTYSNEAKMRTLGVTEAALRQYGAVSEIVAKQMAEGARVRSGASYGVSTTGIAGPGGGTPEKPVGLVYIACAAEAGTRVEKLYLTGDRERIRMRAALSVLDMIRRREEVEEI